MPKQRTNDQRISAARKALRAGGYRDEEMESNIVDLLTDLRHLADKEKLDFSAMRLASRGHYDAEKKQA